MLVYALSWCALWFFMPFLRLGNFWRALLLVLPIILWALDPKLFDWRGLAKSRLFWAIAIFCACGVISSALSPWEASRSSWAKEWFFFTFIGFFGFSILKEQAFRLLALAACAGLACSLLCLPLGLAPACAFLEGTGRMALFLAHPNNFGAFCAALVVLLVYALWNKFTLLHRKLDFLLPLLPFALLLCSGSRTAIGACLVALCLMALWYLRKKPLVLLCLALCCALGFAGLAALAPKDNAQMQRVLRGLSRPWQDETLHSRVFLWKAAYAGYKERPVTGQGLRSFREYYAAYLSRHAEDARKANHYVDQNIITPHSIFLSAATEMGSLGLLAFAIMLVCAFAALRHLGPPNSVAFWGLLFFILLGLMESWMANPSERSLFFALMGCAIAGRGRKQKA